MELVFTRDDERTQIMDARPLQGDFGLRDARLIAPGAPHRSVINYRMSVVSGGRMPRVGSHQLDLAGLRLIRQWISGLDADDRTDPVREAVLHLMAADEETAGELIAAILSTPHGALAMVEEMDQDRLPLWMRRRVIDSGKNHENPSVGRLFERFIPEEQRIVRLGTHIDPTRILQLDGDVRRGRELLFEHEGLSCLKCHQVQQRGHAVGPELEGIGKKYGRSEILESLLAPSGKIDDKFATYQVATGDGQVHVGILVERGDEQLVIKQASGKLVRLASDNVEEIVRQSRSMMPDEMLQDLTAQQAADLLAFLKSL